jgi:hypothetical protein
VTPEKVSSLVSIHPKTFTDDLPDLSKMSLEEVVARFKDVEKKRNDKTEPRMEQESYWPVYHAPVELMSSLTMLAEHLDVSRAILTKCLSRQVVDWYANSDNLTEITTSYKEIYTKIKRRGYTVLRIQAENPAKFSFWQQPEPTKTSVNTIQWVLAKLREVQSVVGVSVIDLLLAGFCWSFTTLEDRGWDAENVARFFQPEVDNMDVIFKCRLLDVRGLYTKFQLFEEVRKNGK